jgi:fatty-acyl-CoA synthase
MIIDIMNYVEKNNIHIKSLKSVLLGGASTPVEVAHRVTRTIPSATDVRIGYGATELGPCTTGSILGDTVERRMETVGAPLDFVEVKIVDPISGEIVKIGEQGELLARGHNVMLGYWDEEEKTREVITDSKWYKTGDLATMDDTGYVKIVGRTKEMIIRGGENIYPKEIEELLHTHPAVLDAYVVGVPDERMGEECCAWIKLRNSGDKLTPDEVKTFCKDKITYFKIPKYILFVEDFPLTGTGKAQKFIMREKSCEILGLKENKKK